jgi:hypothetical protein
MSPSYKIAAFLSVPRNASNTVLNVLAIGPPCDRDNQKSPIIHENHQRGEILASRYDLRQLFVFCFCRNPYDRCVSWFEYHKNLRPYNSLTFEDWIEQGLPHHWQRQNRTDYAKSGLSPLLQYNFIRNCKIDFVGRIETFQDGLNSITQNLNARCVEKGLLYRYMPTYVRLNASCREVSWEDYYTHRSKERVYSLLHEDFRYFGYEA